VDRLSNNNMRVGEVRVAEDADFQLLKTLIDCHDGWRLDYNNKPLIMVWTKPTEETNFKMIKVKALFKDVKATVLYDVLHDPAYRRVWDTYMIESYDIGCLNPNNDIGYYAAKSPPPLKSRDFVLQRSWLDTGNEYIILNHSVYHESVPVKQEYIRAISYLTGFLVRPSGTGCEMGYVTQCDPKGSLPTWLVNKMTQILMPKVVKRIQKACLGYEEWKKLNNPNHKPWINPEQLTLPKINLSQCLTEDRYKSNDFLDSYSIEESNFREKDYVEYQCDCD